MSTETTQTDVVERLENIDAPDRTAALREVAETGDVPDDMGWEDWTYPLKASAGDVVLQVEKWGTPVRWYTVRGDDRLRVHTGGVGGWKVVLPGNLRTQLNLVEADRNVCIRPVTREEVGGE